MRYLPQTQLRLALGIVPQDTVLFNTDLATNVRYGSVRGDAAPATDAEVEEAVRAAQLLDRASTLPLGLKTPVGERGVRLSGGERQRVGIARALLKAPKVVVLDEATSALDSKTEGEVQRALRRVAAGRSALVIAHRLSTVVDADQILVLHGGRIVERGTHAELLALGGEYASMWEAQQEGAAEREPAGEPSTAAVPSS